MNLYRLIIGSFCVSLAWGLVASGCDSGSGNKLSDFFPADNEVPGWVEDPDRVNDDGSANSTGPVVADTEEEAEILVNGHIFIFTEGGKWEAMATEFYKKVDGDTGIKISIYEMQGADAIVPIWNDYVSGGFTEFQLNAGEDGAMKRDQGTYFELHSKKDKYYISMEVSNIQSPFNPPPEEAEGESETFVKAVIVNMP